MEPTSEPENNRQSRGLARFWPVHGIPTPATGESEGDPGGSRDAAGAAAHTSDQQAGAAGPTGEHPQVSDQQSQPHDDQPESDVSSPNPFAPRPHPALTSDTQMVALGSRRPADALLGGTNGTRWTNQGGFPPVETNGHRNGDAGPRHGGAPVGNGQAPVGSASLPGPRSPFGPSGDSSPQPPPFAPAGEETARSAFIPSGDEPPSRPAFGPSGDDAAPGQRSPFAPAANDGPPGARPSFPPADTEAPAGARSPFAPADDGGPAGAPFAPSPFAPQASGSAPVSSPSAGQPAAAPTAPPAAASQPAAAPPQAAGRPVSATPSAAGSAQVPMPMPGRPVSTPPAPAAHLPVVDPSSPTRLEPTGWATPGPRAGASGSASVPVSGSGGGRRSRDDDATDDRTASTARRSTSLDDAQEAAGRRAARPATGEAPLRPGDVNDISITFWTESASEHFRTDWHEVKAQFVDDPVAALTRAHDLLTEAVHELTESMLAERDELDPLRGAAQPDTESMRMAMRGYREFLDRILAL